MREKTIGFRVDANETIATGHLMRCMAIAAECRKRGSRCVFFLAEEKETARLKEAGFPFHILGTDWREMDLERERLSELLTREQPDWLVVDSYQATAEYLAFLEGLVPVLYLDDLGLEQYPVSALLHYSQWQDEDDYEKSYRGTATKLLTGMRYVPLREEFLPQEKRIAREESILLTTGGTDPFHVTERVLRLALRQEELKNDSFQVIVGSMNQDEARLREIAKNSSRVAVHKNVKCMSSYMRRCRLAVSAGGSTLFELCACELPTVCFSFAENQRSFTEEMGKRGVMRYAGDAREDAAIEEKIIRELIWYQEEKRRRAAALAMSRLVDGKGILRIADVLTGGSIKETG